MPVTPSPVSDLTAVPLGMLRRYLKAQHWMSPPAPIMSTVPDVQFGPARVLHEARQVGRRRYDLFVLSTPNQADIELVVPTEQTARDYLRQIQSAIETLSEVENRDATDVIQAIRQIGFDVFRSRIPDAMVRDETIHLEVATGYINGVRRVLAATATTEIEPEPFFLRVLKDAAAYANNCRFAHTFRGSFGFTVESPLVPNDVPTLAEVPQALPFERRVMQRLARGVKDICAAVDRDDTKLVIDGSGEGFSANACEQLAKLVKETAYGGLMVDFAFSPEWRVPAEFQQPPAFKIGPAHVEVMESAARELRKQAPPIPETVFGRVIRLETDADPSDLVNLSGGREIAIQWASPTIGEIAVHVALKPTDYLLALEAHRNGRPVMVSGTLERSSRRGPWVLVEPVNFIVPG